MSYGLSYEIKQLLDSQPRLTIVDNTLYNVIGLSGQNNYAGYHRMRLENSALEILK